MHAHFPKITLKDTPNMDFQSGMTLIELSVVITIILGLVSIAFAGVNSFNKGSARAKCIIQQDKLQKMSLSYANLNELNQGDPFTDLVGAAIRDGYIYSTPQCPDTGIYTFLDNIPNQNERFVICSIANHIAEWFTLLRIKTPSFEGGS